MSPKRGRLNRNLLGKLRTLTRQWSEIKAMFCEYPLLVIRRVPFLRFLIRCSSFPQVPEPLLSFQRFCLQWASFRLHGHSGMFRGYGKLRITAKKTPLKTKQGKPATQNHSWLSDSSHHGDVYSSYFSHDKRRVHNHFLLKHKRQEKNRSNSSEWWVRSLKYIWRETAQGNFKWGFSNRCGESLLLGFIYF